MSHLIRVAVASLVGVVLVAVSVVVLGGGLGGPDDERGTVDVSAPRTPTASVDRRDETGLETVRAYLRAAMGCDDDGRRAMADLSRRTETAAASTMRAACRPTFRWGTSADLRMRPITSGTTRDWEVSFGGPGAPSQLVVRLRQWEPGWQVSGLAPHMSSSSRPFVSVTAFQTNTIEASANSV